jgi:hypothetical protein
MEHIIRSEMKLGKINVFYDFLVVDGLSGKLKWNNGFLSYDNKFEILLYHLIQYKSNVLSQNKVWNKVPNVFFIDKYTFRKNSKRKIKGLLEFVFFNKWKPLYSNSLQLFDYFSAIYIFPKFVSNIEIGNYKNKLGQSFVKIKKNKKGLNTMSIFNFLETQDTIFGSKFNETVFFLKGNSNKKYKIIQSLENKTLNIQENYLDGSFTNYEVLNDFIN